MCQIAFDHLVARAAVRARVDGGELGGGGGIVVECVETKTARDGYVTNSEERDARLSLRVTNHLATIGVNSLN